MILPGALDGGAFVDLLVRAENDRADVVLFQVQGDGADDGAVRVHDGVAFVIQELQQFGHHALAQAVDAGDTVADLQNGSHADLIDCRACCTFPARAPEWR